MESSKPQEAASTPTEKSSPAEISPSSDLEIRAAGRGALWIAAAKAYFMLAGWIMEFALPLLLTSALFGVWKIVVGAVSMVNNTVVTATIQAASKFSSERNADAGVTRTVLRLQLFVGSAIALIFVAIAPQIAKFLRDESLVGYLRITAAIIFCYSLYAVFVGVANGLRRFHVQAGLDMTFSTLKTSLVVGAALLGFGVGGAFFGFVAAAVAVLLIAAVVVGAQPVTQPLPLRRVGSFMGQIAAYTLLLNMLLLVDLFIVKRLAADAALAHGLAQPMVAERSSQLAAYYAAAQTLARIPYQGILALAFVIFPLVSRSTFQNDRETTKSYVRQTLRFSLIFCAALAVVFEANPQAVMRVPYRSEYVAGAASLALLAPAQVFFSLFAIANTMLNGAGKTAVTFFLVLGTVVLLVVSAALSAHWLGATLGLAEATALGVLCANVVGALTALALLHRHLGASMGFGTALRVVIAFFAVTVLGRAVPDGSRIRTLVECALLAGVFLAILAALREFRSADLKQLRRIFARARGRP